ncbi:extracellular solute-binding protein [Nocardioides mangrovicus]|uniref:Extracellular solute-binding protein n=1 Tax=Nocardioides mangrovicus TaxID=2478913 RepID=A0A3L8P6P5_9ACTN|nr:extracellular solute-binding protein [Nocardioides mangrovicus]RLV50774.1 extracellular solute-binding protein [Nocardioides mangrovicus]
MARPAPTHPLRRTATVVATLSVAALALAGCGSSSGSEANGGAGSGKCGTTDKTTLTVGLFGTFGYKENGLYDAYEKRCPNITIKQDVVEQSADYWTRLKTRLASGSGLDDVQAIEIGFVADVVKNHASQFVNWNDVPQAADLKAEFYPWKWQQASNSSGTTTVGLGTDIGPEAMCYRKDLLEKAGLPSDPTTLAQQWSTWDGFFASAKQYADSTSKQAGSAFLDSPASVFSTAVYQGTTAYAKDDGSPDVESSDGVQNAWKLATEAAADKYTAGLEQFSPAWNKAFAGGAFATLACPTWMMGYIQGQAGDDASGTWDIAPVLPGGATNWGGSWLGVPTKAQHKAAAIAFVEWLSAKQQQVAMWTSKKQGGHFPSNSQAAADPAVSQATNSYFNDAPSGQIFGKIASEMKIPPIGLYDTQIQAAMTKELINVATKGTSPDKAWTDALAAVKQITG